MVILDDPSAGCGTVLLGAKDVGLTGSTCVVEMEVKEAVGDFGEGYGRGTTALHNGADTRLVDYFSIFQAPGSLEDETAGNSITFESLVYTDRGWYQGRPGAGVAVPSLRI